MLLKQTPIKGFVKQKPNPTWWRRECKRKHDRKENRGSKIFVVKGKRAKHGVYESYSYHDEAH